MYRLVGLLAAILAVTPGVARAQSEHVVNSNGADVVVTAWLPSAPARASVLLVPGWGGGPADVLGIGRFLSDNGVEAFVLTPRGWHRSGGQASFPNALDDIEAALSWVRGRATHEVALGGHSFGGGMALAYAARDSSVRRIVSVAGTDHGQLIRQYLSDPAFAALLEPLLQSTAAPNGPIRFDVESTLLDLREGQSVFGLRENASALADRTLLMFGGWEDVNTTVDEYLLPQYRAFRAAGASEVTFRVYHTDHGFGNVRSALHEAILEWLLS